MWFWWIQNCGHQRDQLSLGERDQWSYGGEKKTESKMKMELHDIDGGERL